MPMLKGRWLNYDMRFDCSLACQKLNFCLGLVLVVFVIGACSSLNKRDQSRPQRPFADLMTVSSIHVSIDWRSIVSCVETETTDSDPDCGVSGFERDLYATDLYRYFEIQEFERGEEYIERIIGFRNRLSRTIDSVIYSGLSDFFPDNAEVRQMLIDSNRQVVEVSGIRGVTIDNQMFWEKLELDVIRIIRGPIDLHLPFWNVDIYFNIAGYFAPGIGSMQPVDSAYNSMSPDYEGELIDFSYMLQDHVIAELSARLGAMGVITHLERHFRNTGGR